MSALKKLFSSEKPLFQSEIPDQGQHATSLSHTSISPAPNYPDVRAPPIRDRNNQLFLGFEKHFEDLHEQLRPRPSTKRSKYIDQMSSPPRTKRHVDVLEAIFSRQKQHPVSTSIFPTTYNEDIAERNLTNGKQEHDGVSRYSQVISAIYQEDVADRNMVASSPPILVSPPPGEGPTRGYSQRYCMPKKVKESQKAPHSGSFEENAALRAIASDQDLRRLPSCLSNGKSSSGRRHRGDSGANGTIRSRKSAPTFSVQFVGEDEQIPAPVPPNSDGPGRAKKNIDTPVLSDRKSSRNSQARPAQSSEDSTTATKKVVAENKQPENSLPNKPSSRLLSPNTARRGSKRNVRDLSINTQLAAPGKKFAKVSKLPVVPVAAPPCRDLNASLDEIVNSPISLTSPINPSPRLSALEMMNLFKQAYTSSQTASSHPTFESLQDAIIREINSHDAFSHISPQSLSPISPVPSLTPGLNSDGKSTGRFSSRPMTALSRSKSLSSRDGSTISKRSSLHEMSGTPDSQGRELSFPAIKGLETKPDDTAARRRRHTYSQSGSGPRVRICEDNNTSPLPTRSTTGKRPKSSAAAGQLPDVYAVKDSSQQSSPNMLPQVPQGFLSRTVSLFLGSPDTLKQSQSQQSLRTLVNNDHLSRISSSDTSLFDDCDRKSSDTSSKRKPTVSTKSSRLHLFIPSRKPTRPKHIPIVISDTTTNNIITNSCAGNLKKNSNNSPGRRRMPFRIVSG
ncbi:hypothetical protein FQN49_001294 [Arthroderma sp. PD_2]|nr:hypothetical protein FQN49_001294 [Arthroderma sp. PD_2]